MFIGKMYDSDDLMSLAPLSCLCYDKHAGLPPFCSNCFLFSLPY
uniref:Uncharacterized protein n=1 Tax=Rhizophora mucronata TaxID=61149 RepID=A0A2P2QET0_RHIMU